MVGARVGAVVIPETQNTVTAPTAASPRHDEPRVTLNLKPCAPEGRLAVAVCQLLPWSPLLVHDAADVPDTTSRLPIEEPYIE